MSDLQDDFGNENDDPSDESPIDWGYSERDDAIVTEAVDSQPSDSHMVTELADDMTPDAKLPDMKGDAKMFAFITGWHPFMRFFVRVSQMLYSKYDEGVRPHILASRHRGMFWFCWCADNAVMIISVLAVFIILGLTAFKAFF